MESVGSSEKSSSLLNNAEYSDSSTSGRAVRCGSWFVSELSVWRNLRVASPKLVSRFDVSISSCFQKGSRALCDSSSGSNSLFSG
jgi:hypothetical protein